MMRQAGIKVPGLCSETCFPALAPKMASRGPIFFLQIIYLILNTCRAEICIEEQLEGLKEKISGVESKLEQFNSLYLLQLESKLTQLFLKLDRVEASVKSLHSKQSVDNLGIIVDRLQLLEKKIENQSPFNEVLDKISNVEKRIGNLHEFQRVLHDQTKKSNPTMCTRAPCSQSSPASVEDALMDLLEVAVASDEGSDIPAPRSLKGSNMNSSDPGIRDGNRKASTLFGRLWKRMMRPSLALDRKMTILQEVTRQASDVCEKSLAIQTKMSESQCTGSQIVPHVDRLASLVGDRVTRIEQRLLHLGHQTEKVLDRVYAKCVPTGNPKTGNSGTAALSPDEGPVTTPEVSVTAKDCAELQKQSGLNESGVYQVTFPGLNRKTEVFCDFTTDGGGWTVIQRRGYFQGIEPESFNRNWAVYRKGFGNVRREFWLGNHPIHALTADQPSRIRVELEDFDGNTAYAVYSTFKVDSEDERFRLHVGGYSGNASDSLGSHNGKYFSTHDRINDEVDPCCSCAVIYEGGWWFYACFESHLNGPYLHTPVDDQYFRGIIWEYWKGDYSLKYTEMKIRPRDFVVNGTPNDKNDDDYSVEDP